MLVSNVPQSQENKNSMKESEVPPTISSTYYMLLLLVLAKILTVHHIKELSIFTPLLFKCPSFSSGLQIHIRAHSEAVQMVHHSDQHMSCVYVQLWPIQIIDRLKGSACCQHIIAHKAISCGQGQMNSPGNSLCTESLICPQPHVIVH